MRYLFGVMCALTLLVALPQRVAAQTGHEGQTRLALVAHAKRPLPPQLMLRASYYYVDVDPSGAQTTKPGSDPALELEVDSAGLEVTPAAPPTLEELERRAFEDLERLEKKKQEKKRRNKRGRAIGIGVGVTVGVVLVGLAIGAAVAVSNSFD